MIILIAAHSCTGKTLMSQRLLEKYHMPFYSVDHFKMGLYRSDENCGFTPYDSNEHIGKKLWPMIKSIMMTAIESKQDLIIEGCYLLPEFLNDLDDTYKQHILPVFFGFSQGYIENNFMSKIVGFRDAIEKRCYPEERPIENFIEEHLKFKTGCMKHNVKYFEINNDYIEETQKIYDHIDKIMSSRGNDYDI